MLGASGFLVRWIGSELHHGKRSWRQKSRSMDQHRSAGGKDVPTRYLSAYAFQCTQAARRDIYIYIYLDPSFGLAAAAVKYARCRRVGVHDGDPYPSIMIHACIRSRRRVYVVYSSLQFCTQISYAVSAHRYGFIYL